MSFACSKCREQVERMPKENRCPNCLHWGTLASGSARRLRAVNDDEGDYDEDEEDVGAPICLVDVEHQHVDHVPTGERFFDALLGGGLVPGAVVLLAGDPGSGKTTLAFQIAKWLGVETLYASAEQQESRLKTLAKRLKAPLKKIHVWHTDVIDAVVERDLEFSPRLLIIDALQAFRSRDVNGAPGSNEQSQAVMRAVTAMTQEFNLITLVLSRLNADGRTAGPNAIEHDGDATLFLRTPYSTALRGHVSNDEEPETDERILYVKKNRDGPSRRKCMVTMTPKGLEFA